MEADEEWRGCELVLPLSPPTIAMVMQYVMAGDREAPGDRTRSVVVPHRRVPQHVSM